MKGFNIDQMHKAEAFMKSHINELKAGRPILKMIDKQHRIEEVAFAGHRYFDEAGNMLEPTNTRAGKFYLKGSGEIMKPEELFKYRVRYRYYGTEFVWCFN